MTGHANRPLAIYYEHPTWFRPLFAELDRRGVPYVKVDAARHRYDPSEPSPYALVFNRMSPSACLRGQARAISYTTQYLAHLERQGTRTINGLRAWHTEISKAEQLSLLESLNLPYPRTRVIHESDDAVAAADGLRFPVAFKPNVGGSGAGVRRFEAPQSLAAAAVAGELDFGVDGTGLVQEFIPAESGSIVRVEVLDGRFLYAIRVYPKGDDFNLCPADICQDSGDGEVAGASCLADAAENGLRVEGYTPPAAVIASVERILAAGDIRIGGVEYVVDERDSRLYFYDINALSNFVADAPRIIGFDPFEQLTDWLEEEVEQACTPDRHRIMTRTNASPGHERFQNATVAESPTRG